MALTDEHAKSIKEQLLKQLSAVPKDQADKLREYILLMNNEQLEEFLKKNTAETPNQKSKKPLSCIFCSLANQETSSFSIYEDKDYLAPLEIKPYSSGHIIIIPKKHIEEAKSIPSRAFSVAKMVGKHIIKKLGAESFNLTTSEEMNHAIINVIPTYKDEPLDYTRKPVNQEKLKELAIKIGELKKAAKKIKKAIKPTKEMKDFVSTLIKLNRRIP